MRILVLGSAAGGGFPQWNCNCANCRRARAGDAQATPRSQSSIAVSGDDARWVLLNAAPDLRQQILNTPQLHPRASGRDSPIASVVLTSGDVDHVAGLLCLRESQPLTLYAADRVLATLRDNSIFKALHQDLVKRIKLPLEQSIALSDATGAPLGLRATAFAVPGKVALYLEDEKAGPDFGTAIGDAIGLEISDDRSRSFFYLPGCAAMPDALAARLKDAKLVFFDGTLWRDDEMIAMGLGAKTGRRMGHMSVSGPDGAIAAFAPLGVRRKVFVHMNNTNPILIADSPERAQAEAAGWEIAYDGMEIRP